jgi:glycosyltransferase involved in cell wall biosynthesis
MSNGTIVKINKNRAVRRPIIYCADGQPAEYMKETGSGVVVKPGDYRALANAILYLKDNPEVAERLGVSGRNYVVENLSIGSIGQEMVNVLQQMAKGV